MLVLDANILIRAVLGSKVLRLLTEYSGKVLFLAPDSVFDEAREHLPAILEKRGIPPGPALETLSYLAALVQSVDRDTWQVYESPARARIGARDEDDWPVLAVALAFNCPIWTEDNDFFGCGVATWTTGKIELYLNSPNC